MELSSLDQTIPQPDSNYHLLRVYAYYRTLLSCILLSTFITGVASSFLGTAHPSVFAWTIWIYTASNMVVLGLLWHKRFTPNNLQIITILAVDIIAMVFLMHASKGAELGYLILVCVAAGGIFLQGKTVLGLAGMATLLVLGESLYDHFYSDLSDRTVFSAGVFGILIFSTAYAFSLLSERIRISNLEAYSKAQQAAYLEKLSQIILERMRTGIVVINPDEEIVLINQGAKTLLGIHGEPPRSIHQLPPLDEHLNVWKTYPHTRSPHLKMPTEGPEIRVNFAPLEAFEQSDILLFIEDNRQLSQQAQQLKLASLGRLTASIAHEVRNPLGAISHAAQLLNESTGIEEADRRLTEIIQTHSRRVNHIIENVLQLSRRKNASPEPVDLSIWLPTFVQEFQHSKDAKIELTLLQPAVKTRVDLSQLQQVLTNLATNGLRYSQEKTGREILSLVAGVDSETELPYIEVIDEGVGIAREDVEQVFEPFFTTQSTGSGLGLYISRELCEANQASLDYKRTQSGKSCFRITLAHPERVF